MRGNSSVLLWVPVALLSGSMSLGAPLGFVVGFGLTLLFLKMTLGLDAPSTGVVWVFNAFGQILALSVVFSPIGERLGAGF